MKGVQVTEAQAVSRLSQGDIPSPPGSWDCHLCCRLLQRLQPTLPAYRLHLGICKPAGQSSARCRRVNTPSLSRLQGWICTPPCPLSSLQSCEHSYKSYLLEGSGLQPPSGELAFSRHCSYSSQQNSHSAGVITCMLQPNCSHTQHCPQNYSLELSAYAKNSFKP